MGYRIFPMKITKYHLIPFVIQNKLHREGFGWGNGYVAISKHHPYYEIDYTKINSINVHGGLTFSGFTEHWNIPKKYWVIGFDTCHYNSIYYLPDEKSVMKETLKLKEQLENIK